MRLINSITAFLENFVKRTGAQLPKWTNVILWLVGIVILTSLMIKEMYPLFNEYKTNNVAALVKVVAGNKTLRTPPLTLCIPRDPVPLRNIARFLTDSKNDTSECVECAKMTKMSWDVWRNMSFPKSNTMDDNYYLLSAALSKKLLLDGVRDDFESLSLNNSDWNQPLIEAVWDLFDCVADIDAYVDFGSDDEEWYSECSGKHDVNLAVLSKQKIEKLYERIIDIMCQYTKFENSPESCQQIFDSSSSVIYTNVFCFKVPILEDVTTVSFNSQTQTNVTWPALVPTVFPFHVYTDTSLLTWPLGSHLTNDLLYMSDTMNPSLLVGQEEASLKYLVLVTVTDTKDSACFVDRTPAVCKGNCMLAKIVKKCKCIPFTFRKQVETNDRPYCNATYYAECRLDKKIEEADCRTTCDYPCEYTFYQWHPSHQITPNVQNRRSFKLVLTPVLSPFVAFTVTTKDTPEQFLSQIAAIFNLYLGFSGLSAVAALVVCLDLLGKWFRSRKQMLIKVNAAPRSNVVHIRDLQSPDVTRSTSTVIALTPTRNASLVNTPTEQGIENLNNKLEDVMAFLVQLKDQVDELKRQQETSIAQLKGDIVRLESRL